MGKGMEIGKGGKEAKFDTRLMVEKKGMWGMERLGMELRKKV